MDTAERIEKKNHETVNNINTLVTKITKAYHTLSDSLFDLSQEFKVLAQGYKTLEQISGTGLKTDFIKQGDLYETMMDTIIDSSKSIKRSGSNFERHLPPFFKLQDQNFQHLDHVKFTLLEITNQI